MIEHLQSDQPKEKDCQDPDGYQEGTKLTLT
jgi:hypothetical protein